MLHRIALARSQRLAILVLCFALGTVSATAKAAGTSSDGIWKGTGRTQIEGVTAEAAAFRLDAAALEVLLSGAPVEGSGPLAQSPVIIELPMPDGSFTRFRFEESPIFEPKLSASYPDIKSYRGQGLDIAGATVRFDWTPQGFHALILGPGLAVSVHPVSAQGGEDYVSYQLSDARKHFECGVSAEALGAVEPYESSATLASPPRGMAIWPACHVRPSSSL